MTLLSRWDELLVYQPQNSTVKGACSAAVPAAVRRASSLPFRTINKSVP
jgi:hypothetical protein